MNVRILGGTTNCDVIIRNVNVEKKKKCKCWFTTVYY